MNYISGVFEEMSKVTWPTVKETNKFTWTVLLMVLFFALFFALTDFGFNEFIRWFVRL